MDELTLLRDLDTDVAAPDPVVVLRARRRLLATALRGTHRRRARALVGLAAAAVVTGGVVVAPTWWHHDGRVVASADAAAVLERAAQVTLTTADPRVGPGQYLQITTHALDLNGSGGAGHSLWLSRSTFTTWVPADPDDTWVQQQSPRELVRYLVRGDETPAHADEPSRVLRAPQGTFYGPAGDNWQEPTAAFLASLPRDPDALLSRIRSDAEGHGSSPDDEAFEYVASVLKSGIVPGDLRAALFEAAQQIPGLSVTDTATNLDGHEGVAIGRHGGDDLQTELIFDRDSGLFIGERSVTEDDYEGIAPGTVVESSALSTRVVDGDRLP